MNEIEAEILRRVKMLHTEAPTGNTIVLPDEASDIISKMGMELQPGRGVSKFYVKETEKFTFATIVLNQTSTLIVMRK